MILNGWYKFLEKRIGKYPFIFKPAVDCAKCVSGQMALWVYLVKCWGGYDLIDHIFTVSLSIFLAIALKAAYNKLLSMSF